MPLDKDMATEKAKALIAGAVTRIAHHVTLQRNRVPVHPDVMVVGGGIAGIQAALTMAAAGKKVYLVEREPTIGGHMAKFDKTFPTLDCSACILTPKMSSVRSHPNITLWTYSEVESVEGFVGNFTVKVRRKPRYVIEDQCVGCLDCIDACIYKTGKTPDEFNVGLSKRKPIYVPFPQATPLVAVIDDQSCIEFKTHKCKKTCAAACQKNAIDFTQTEEIKEVPVGAIILATGFKTFDAARIDRFGYGKYPNVHTSLELERMVNAAGPTNGEVVMANGAKPTAVGILHCVGSRDLQTNRYCSRVCCMYSLKLAHLVKERTGAEVYNFYIDMRTPGKGYEEFYDRLLQENVHFIRGRVAEISDWSMNAQEEGKLTIRVEVYAERSGAAHSRGHGCAVGGPGAAAGCGRSAATVQHQLQHRGLVPGASSQAGAGVDLHRRHIPRGRMPGTEGYPGLRGPGRRRGRRGAGADRPRVRRTRTKHRLLAGGTVFRLSHLPGALSIQCHHVRQGEGRRSRERRALQGLRHVCGGLSVRCAPAESLHR